MLLFLSARALISMAPQRKKRGLSPFLLFRNQMVAALKASRGGATLSAEEIAAVHARARVRWDAQTENDKAMRKELYQHWRERPSEPRQKAEPKPYYALWGGGSRACPVSAAELCRHYREFGWPSDEEVYSPNEFNIDQLCGVDFDSMEHASFLHGCGRSLPGVCEAEASSVPSFSLVHRGFTNFVESLPRSVSESGCVLLMLECQPTQLHGQIARQVYLVTGACWNPKVCDVARCYFEVEQKAWESPLTYPFDVCLARRKNKVSDSFECLDTMTSAELSLALIKGYRAAELIALDYKVVLKCDQSLNWSRVSAGESVGMVYQHDMKTAMLSEVLAAKRRDAALNRRAQGLRQGDPMGEEAARGGQRGRGRERGRGRGGAKGRGRARGRCKGGEEEGGAPPLAEQASDLGPEAPPQSANADELLAADVVEGRGRGEGRRRREGGLWVENWDGFDLEGELEAMSDEDGWELAASFEEHEADMEEPEKQDAPTASDASEASRFTQLVLMGASDEGDAVGLSEPAADAETELRAMEPSSASDAKPDDADPGGSPDDPPKAPDLLDGLEGPTPLGYVTYRGSALMRIQRGKKQKPSLCVRCYWHSSCSFLLLPSRLAPSDAELFRWALELPRADSSTMSRAEMKSLAARHMESAKRFRESGHTAASSSKS